MFQVHVMSHLEAGHFLLISSPSQGYGQLVFLPGQYLLEMP